NASTPLRAFIRPVAVRPTRLPGGQRRPCSSPPSASSSPSGPRCCLRGFSKTVKFSGRNIDPVVMMAAVPNHLDQLRAHFAWLDQTLADGRPFLQGPAASLADLAAYHPAWYLRQNFGSAAPPLDGFPRLQTWAERI